MKPIIFLTLAGLAHGASANELPLRDGDLIFQTSRSAQSVAVQKATGSRYSHMGIVFIRDGKPFVYEAADTVRYTPLEDWVARGMGHHFVAKRLRDASTRLHEVGVERLRQAARAFEGKTYDLTFEWSDDRIYCSELAWKIYQRALGIELGKLQKIKEFNLKDPSVRQKMKERYGEHVPLEEPAISPVSVFDSPRLVTVREQ